MFATSAKPPPNIAQHLVSPLFAYDLPSSQDPLGYEGKRLRLAFLSSNIISVLSLLSKEPSAAHHADAETIRQALTLLDDFHSAWRFLYASETNLMPSSEALDTVADLAQRVEEFKPQEIGPLVERSKDLLTALIQTTASSSAPDKARIDEACSFFKAVQAIVLGKMETEAPSEAAAQG